MKRLLLAVLLSAPLAACTTVDVYRYEARPLPAATSPDQALRASLADLEAVTYGHDGESRVDRAVLDRHPGALELYLTAPSTGHQFSLCYHYNEIPRDVRAVTNERDRWTVWVANPGARPDLGFHFRSARSVRLFLDGATAARSLPPRI